MSGSADQAPRTVEERLTSLERAAAARDKKIDGIAKTSADSAKKLDELVEIFRTAGHVLSAIKWLSVVGAGVAAIFAGIHWSGK